MNFKAEIFRILKFGVVGASSTVVHLGLLWWLLADNNDAVILKNTIAYCAGFVVSFSGNYFWTFTQSASPKQAIIKFGLVAFIGFLSNTVLLYFFHKNPFFSVEVTSILIALAVAGMTFLLSRLWAFRGPRVHKNTDMSSGQSEK